MFKIGEFSKLTQVSIRMLRYYDEMGLLKPAAIDPWTGYRLYGVKQIPVLNKIVYLRDAGFQVAEIAKALQAPDEQTFLAQLERKDGQIEQQIQAEQEQLERLMLIRSYSGLFPAILSLPCGERSPITMLRGTCGRKCPSLLRICT